MKQFKTLFRLAVALYFSPTGEMGHHPDIKRVMYCGYRRLVEVCLCMCGPPSLELKCKNAYTYRYMNACTLHSSSVSRLEGGETLLWRVVRDDGEQLRTIQPGSIPCQNFRNGILSGFKEFWWPERVIGFWWSLPIALCIQMHETKC